MAINLSDNIHVSSPKPTDSRYLNITSPWTSVSAVNAAIPSGERYSGLTVNIGGYEYWYYGGIANNNLVIKNIGVLQNIYNITGITTNTTLNLNQYIVFVDSTGGAVTITLPPSPTNGQAYKIKDIGGYALTNNITIIGIIDSSANALINTNGGAFELVYDTAKSSWFNVSKVI